jgi:hypothetical protein
MVESQPAWIVTPRAYYINVAALNGMPAQRQRHLLTLLAQIELEAR